MANNVTKHLLKTSEWLAQNAFLPPGFHRLITATGLAVGLYTGRKIMDVVTAKNFENDRLINREEITPLLRPLHGVMTYNAYSDNATDRWKSIADKTAPLILGTVGAYLGSKHFFYGRMPSLKGLGKPLNGLSYNTIQKTEAAIKHNKLQSFSIDIADTAANIAQSDASNKLAAGNFSIGSSAGVHLFGALFPLNNGMSSIRFQQIVRQIDLPFLKPINRFFGNRGTSSLRYRSSLSEISKWAESNTIKQTSRDAWAHGDALKPIAQDILQIFKHTNGNDKNRAIKMVENILDRGHTLHQTLRAQSKSEAEISAELKRFYDGELLGIGLERNLIQHGFKDHLPKATLGDSGPFTFLSRLLGSTKREREVEQKFRDHLRETFPDIYKNYNFGASRVQTHHGKVVGALGATAGVGWLATIPAHAVEKENHLAEQSKIAESGTHSRVAQAAQHYEQQEKQPHTLLSWINGKPLDVLHYLSNLTITPPSMHRLMSAATLSLGLFAGVKTANIMAGRQLITNKSAHNAASLIAKEKVFAPLRPLHGILAYTPNLATTQDRARQAAHHLIPVVTGALGTYIGSLSFFHDREQALKKPEFLEEYADRIAMEQSKFYMGSMALTSIFNTGSGLHLLPIGNYSSSLHNRYLMASGHQVALPGLGKWWSGNQSIYPWGVARTLDYMVKYLARDDEEFPKQLPALTHALLGKLYPHLSTQTLAQKEAAFMEHIYTLRDPYLKNHALDTSKSAELENLLTQHLTKDGLEKTLTKIGLNVTDANLAHNGASGKIANYFSSQNQVDTLSKHFQEKARARLTLSPQSATPSTKIDPQSHQHEETLVRRTSLATQKAA